MSIYVTEYVKSEALSFLAAVQKQESKAMCSCIYEICLDDDNAVALSLSADFPERLDNAKFYLMNGTPLAILPNAEAALKQAGAGVVIWLRDIDSMIVQAWPKCDYQSEFSTSQGELIELVPYSYNQVRSARLRDKESKRPPQSK